MNSCNSLQKKFIEYICFCTTNSGILKKILPLFSYILHPIFISLYATLFYLFYKDDIFSTKEKYFVLIQILVINIIVPVLFFLLLKSTGHVKSIMLSQTSERTIPLILQCFLYILLVKRSIIITRYPELHFFFLAALFSTILALVFALFKIKASLHMVAISGLTIFIIGLNIHLQLHNPYWPALLILLSGIVASSRLEMNAHTSREILIGLFVGIMPQLLFLYLWL